MNIVQIDYLKFVYTINIDADQMKLVNQFSDSINTL